MTHTSISPQRVIAEAIRLAWLERPLNSEDEEAQAWNLLDLEELSKRLDAKGINAI